MRASDLPICPKCGNEMARVEGEDPFCLSPDCLPPEPLEEPTHDDDSPAEGHTTLRKFAETLTPGGPKLLLAMFARLLGQDDAADRLLAEGTSEAVHHHLAKPPTGEDEDDPPTYSHRCAACGWTKPGEPSGNLIRCPRCRHFCDLVRDDPRPLSPPPPVQCCRRPVDGGAK